MKIYEIKDERGDTLDDPQYYATKTETFTIATEYAAEIKKPVIVFELATNHGRGNQLSRQDLIDAHFHDLRKKPLAMIMPDGKKAPVPEKVIQDYQ